MWAYLLWQPLWQGSSWKLQIIIQLKLQPTSPLHPSIHPSMQFRVKVRGCETITARVNPEQVMCLSQSWPKQTENHSHSRSWAIYNRYINLTPQTAHPEKTQPNGGFKCYRTSYFSEYKSLLFFSVLIQKLIKIFPNNISVFTQKTDLIFTICTCVYFNLILYKPVKLLPFPLHKYIWADIWSICNMSIRL